MFVGLHEIYKISQIFAYINACVYNKLPTRQDICFYMPYFVSRYKNYTFCCFVIYIYIYREREREREISIFGRYMLLAFTWG